MFPKKRGREKKNRFHDNEQQQQQQRQQQSRTTGSPLPDQDSVCLKCCSRDKDSFIFCYIIRLGMKTKCPELSALESVCVCERERERMRETRLGFQEFRGILLC